MKVRVKKTFRDIDTKQVMRPGNEIDYAEERARKLARSGFVEILEAQEVVEKAEPAIIASEQETEPDAGGIEEEPAEKPEGEQEAEKHEFAPFPEKDEQPGPKKRGRKPKQ